MIVHLFETFKYAHIVSGAVGLICVWVPIAGRKGGFNHKRWGKVFAWSMLFTGSFAIVMSTCTLIAPVETHPFWDNVPLIRAVFGWMMLYLAVMTIMLAWYGLLCIRNRNNHAANRNAVNFALQFATLVAAVNCAWQGLMLGDDQPIRYLLIGISSVGLAASILNTWFILQRDPPVNEWLIQHTRGQVGAGISVYTAFLAFGAVNLLPVLAFNPLLWALPSLLGVPYLLYHQYRITVQRRQILARRSAAAG